MPPHTRDFDLYPYLYHSQKGRIDTQVKGKMKKHMLDSFQTYVSLLQNFIKQGQAQGILKDFPSLTLTKALKGIMDEFTFHWMRNLSVSALSAMGVEITHLSGMLGHTDGSTIRKYLSLQREASTTVTNKASAKLLGI